MTPAVRAVVLNQFGWNKRDYLLEADEARNGVRMRFPDGTVLDVGNRAAFSTRGMALATAALNHLQGYGQSLSEGSQGTPAVTVNAVANGKMFVGHVRPINDGGSSPYASMIDLRENDAQTILGETPMSATVHSAVAAYTARTGGAPSFNYFASTAGEGGKSLAELSEGGTYFTELKAHITNAKALADAAGITYNLAGIVFTHGHQDQNGGTLGLTYERQLIAIRNAINAHAVFTVGGSAKVPIILSTLSGFNYPTFYPEIPLAQRRLAQDHAEFINVGPYYQMTTADGTHLTNVGYVQLGGYYGVALDMLQAGIKYRPLDIIEITLSGSSFICRFDVQSGTALTLDTTLVSDPGSMGFTALAPGGGSLTITSVTLRTDLGTNYVEVATSATLADGSALQYGFNGTATGGPTSGPRGCLRDSDTRTLVHEGSTYNLYRWCMYFEEAAPFLRPAYQIP